MRRAHGMFALGVVLKASVFLVASGALVVTNALVASAQIIVSANDAKAELLNGVNTPVRNPPPDTVTVIDVSGVQPRVIGSVAVPTSVIGPPQSVAITPDRTLALVTSSTKIDPADPTKTTPDDVVSVIELGSGKTAVIATLHPGKGPAGVSINRAGTLALVANRSEGTVSVLTIKGRTVAVAAKVDLGAPDSLPSHVVFTPDGRRALVTRNGDSLVSVLSVDGSTVRYTKTDVTPRGLKPYGIEMTPAGDVALVANIGAGAGKDDSIDVIDLTSATPTVTGSVAVGSIPEGLSISADGKFVAVTVMNGSNQPAGSVGFHDFGILKILSLAGARLAPVAETHIGHWCQGAAWSRDHRTLLVQCMADHEIEVFQFDGAALHPAAPLKIQGGPAGIRSAP